MIFFFSQELLSQFFEKFPNTNVNMRRNKYSEKFKNSDLSISVEPDSPIQNSRLATDDISTTARTQSLPVSLIVEVDFCIDMKLFYSIQT